MSIFRVTVAQTVFDTYDVEADTEEVARELALAGSGTWLNESADGADQSIVEVKIMDADS